MDRYEFCRYAYQMVVEWSNIFQKLFLGVCISVTGENKKKKLARMSQNSPIIRYIDESRKEITWISKSSTSASLCCDQH